MRKYLYWWNKLPKEDKTKEMNDRNIKAILYYQIKEIYNDIHSKNERRIKN